MATAGSVTLIDELMPRFDEFERHQIVISATPAVVYAALHRVDLLGSRVIRWLLMLRSLPAALRRPRDRRPRVPITLGRMLEGGFVLLGERAERELALGVVGRFWTAAGTRVTLDAEGFRAFDAPGYARVVWDFRLVEEAGGTRLSTETRIVCTDARSRRRFRLYWRVIRPFSGLLRIALLRAVAREATR
jgi:hypothetical protein